ncbi:MAG: hypothetical protein CL917_05070 [Deltaproteobacteria bacterium]|nr:hypothetical protein [Deltaproteobacteria bacterium]
MLLSLSATHWSRKKARQVGPKRAFVTENLFKLDTLPDSSWVLDWSFAVVPLVVGGTVVWAIRRTSGPSAGIWAGFTLALWLILTAGLAGSGFLDQWNPPRMLLLFASILIFLLWSARQPWTQRLGDLSLKWLVGFQAFRIAVEVMLHEAVLEGLANPTITWTGTNFDILPGISALLLCPFANKLKPQNLQVWNVAMAIILVFTVVTAILAAPTPFRQIGGTPANIFFARFPFVWLPGVLVTSAWLGHIVLFRRLRRNPGP